MKTPFCFEKNYLLYNMSLLFPYVYVKYQAYKKEFYHKYTVGGLDLSITRKGEREMCDVIQSFVPTCFEYLLECTNA